MASLKPTIINSPAPPPDQYDQKYMQELVATLRRLIQTLQTFPVLTASQLTVSSTAIQEDTTGLQLGTVYLKTLQSGEKVLSIVLSTDPQ
jgi:hypothetical protein